MNLLEKVLRKFRLGEDSSGHVQLKCPESGNIIANEHVKPTRWIEEKSIAVYHCPECDSEHSFLWGPPAPVYLEDGEYHE